MSVRAPAFPRMRIALNFVANGARLRAHGAREVEIQIAPANTDANAFAACANDTIESACRAADGPPGDWISALGYRFPIEMP